MATYAPSPYLGIPPTGTPPQGGVSDPTRYIPDNYPLPPRRESVARQQPPAPYYQPPVPYYQSSAPDQQPQPMMTHRRSDADNLSPPELHYRPEPEADRSRPRRPSHASYDSHRSRDSHRSSRSRHSHDDERQAQHHHHHHHHHDSHHHQPQPQPYETEDRPKRKEPPRPTLGDTVYAVIDGIKKAFR